MSRLFGGAKSYVSDADLVTKKFVTDGTADVPLFHFEFNGSVVKKKLAFQIFDDAPLTDHRMLKQGKQEPFVAEYQTGTIGAKTIGPMDMVICLCGHRVMTVNWNNPTGSSSLNIRCVHQKCNFIINKGDALAHLQAIQEVLYKPYPKLSESGLPMLNEKGEQIMAKDYFFMVPRMCSVSKNWMTCLHPPTGDQTYGTWKCYRHDENGRGRPTHRCKEVKDLECFVHITEENQHEFIFPAIRDASQEPTIENAWWTLMMEQDSTFPFKPIVVEGEINGKKQKVEIAIAANKDGSVSWDLFEKHAKAMLKDKKIGIARGRAVKRARKETEEEPATAAPQE